MINIYKSICIFITVCLSPYKGIHLKLVMSSAEPFERTKMSGTDLTANLKFQIRIMLRHKSTTFKSDQQHGFHVCAYDIPNQLCVVRTVLRTYNIEYACRTVSTVLRFAAYAYWYTMHI